MTNIFVPRSFNQRPGFVCRLCQEPHYTSQALARHVRDHAKHDEAQIAFMSARERHPGIFGDDGVDVEFEQWHRKRGAARRD